MEVGRASEGRQGVSCGQDFYNIWIGLQSRQRMELGFCSPGQFVMVSGRLFYILVKDGFDKLVSE